jgi:integrase/recombinase XerD
MDEQDIESPTDLSTAEANRLGRMVSNEFSGTTGRYRWDRIYAFYDWLITMDITEKNPLERWNKTKAEKWGLSKSTEQEHHVGEEETYAITQEQVRQMESNVGRNRVRDQLIIRLLWQTGMRRKEASLLELSDLDREKREITLRSTKTKNGNKRVVAYQDSLEQLLAEWLDYGLRKEMAAGKEHEYLLVGQTGVRLQPDRINQIVRDAAIEAGINRRLYADANAATNENGEKEKNRWLITAHNIRHGYGSHLVNNTDAGLWEVSQQMGHSSVSITESTYVEDDPRAGIDHSHQYGPE